MLTLAVYNSTPERNKSVYVYLTIFKISRFMEDVNKQRRNFISLCFEVHMVMTYDNQFKKKRK